MPQRFQLIAKTFFGLEQALADELRSLGASDATTGRRMVSFTADQRMMYRVNLLSRLAVRVLKPIHAFRVRRAGEDPARALYRGVQKVKWLELLSPRGTLAIDPVVHSKLYTNSLYAAQVTKDAIVDQFRQRSGERPNVDLEHPSLRINLHISEEAVTIYLDSSGDSLHKRGYRAPGAEAPLNEVLAAGLLRLSGWDAASPLADFMCGSGTIAIEAAQMARNIAPGALRKQFGFEQWTDFDAVLWNKVRAEARAAERPMSFPIQASDIEPKAITAAQENARRAKVADEIRFEVADFALVKPPATPGTLVTNPPYDERMKVDEINALYQRIGDSLKRQWTGYTAHVLTGALAAAKQIGLRSTSKTQLFNGPIECRLLKFKLFSGSEKDQRTKQEEPQMDANERE